MPILVQKYGGSSLSDLTKVRSVAQRVTATRDEGYDVVVVVSAMGDTTDELLEMARELAGRPSRRELDMLLSVGERISTALLSIAIQERGHEAVSLTGSQCGIITTHNHSNARIMDVRPFRVQDELHAGKIVIVAGYQGTSYRRDVTTLGRGGSDTTAVALAAALGAEACEIYSDVDGIYSADPSVVLSARQLVELSHDEMLEMARSGARVLNEQAVEFARRSKIALYAKKAHDDASRGTVVRPDGFDERARRAEDGQPAVAISHIDRGLWVCAEASADALMDALDGTSCVVCDWHPGRRFEAFVSLENRSDAEVFTGELDALGDDVSVAIRGLVSVVGQGIGSEPRWVRMAQDGLRRSDVAVDDVHVTPARLSWVVASQAVSEAAVILHRMFIEAATAP